MTSCPRLIPSCSARATMNLRQVNLNVMTLYIVYIVQIGNTHAHALPETRAGNSFEPA